MILRNSEEVAEETYECKRYVKKLSTHKEGVQSPQHHNVELSNRVYPRCNLDDSYPQRIKKQILGVSKNRHSNTHSHRRQIPHLSQIHRGSMRFLYIVLSILISSQALAVHSQTSDTCACSPSKFQFTLDFNRTCNPTNVLIDDDAGVEGLFCQIVEEPQLSTRLLADMVPVEVFAINIFELGQGKQVLKQTFLGGDTYVNGDTFTYESIVGSSGGNSTSSISIPGGLQMVLKGRNADGVEIHNSFILIYTNLCDTVPFTEGDSIGWAVIVSL